MQKQAVSKRPSLTACFVLLSFHCADISFLLVAAEDALTTAITFSALIAIGLQKKESGSGKKALGKIRKALGGS